MARHRRSSGHPPEGPGPRDRWREYDDDEIADDAEWVDDDVDPFDDRPLPRRRRPRSRVPRALAWIGGGVLLMVLGALLALATWRGPATVVSGTSPPEPAAAEAERTEEIANARQEAAEQPRTGEATSDDTATGAAPADRPAAADQDVGVSPPPLPPLPPGLEIAAPSAATRVEAGPRPDATPRPDAPALPEAPTRSVPDASAPTSPPAVARDASRPPVAPPGADTRGSEEIMADFLVRSGDRVQAEDTARAYAEWYAAGSPERAYWLRVLASIRARP